MKLTKDDSPVVLAHQSISAPNPGQNGTLTVRTLVYGSGTDKRRSAFRDSVVLKTQTVDGSALVSATPEIAKPRAKYWGFDFKKLPINGRVWYPNGDGPFPLVLVVHGNHNMKDFSDPGYGYLGQLLASRGFILVSVDENFINGNLRGENDGRGWLLLEHLRRWRTWNDSSGSPFYHKVDMGNIALMGHSRGGEAVALVALEFFDHKAGKTRTYQVPDGRTVTGGPNRPWTWEIAEMFKIEKGKIRRIEAILTEVPYGMPSGWSSWEDGMSDRARDVTK